MVEAAGWLPLSESKATEPAWLQGGKMSQHLDSLSVGDCVAVRGPFEDVRGFAYLGAGKFRWVPMSHHDGIATLLDCAPKPVSRQKLDAHATQQGTQY